MTTMWLAGASLSFCLPNEKMLRTDGWSTTTKQLLHRQKWAKMFAWFQDLIKTYKFLLLYIFVHVQKVFLRNDSSSSPNEVFKHVRKGGKKQPIFFLFSVRLKHQCEINTKNQNRQMNNPEAELWKLFCKIRGQGINRNMFFHVPIEKLIGCWMD